MNIQRFAMLLKQKRTTLKYSQSKVAEMCYLSKSSYNHLERGKRFPSLDTLIRLSDILNTDPKEFFSALLSDDRNTNNIEKSAVINETSSKSIEYSAHFEKSFNLLTEYEQKAILDIIDSMLHEKQIK